MPIFEERTLKTSAALREEARQAAAAAAAAASHSAAVQAATAQRAEVAAVRVLCRGRQSFLATVVPADPFAEAHVGSAGCPVRVQIQVPAFPDAPHLMLAAASDMLLSTYFANVTTGELVLFPSPPTTFFYRFVMPPRPEAVHVSKQFRFTPLDQDTERVVSAAVTNELAALRCQQHGRRSDAMPC